MCSQVHYLGCLSRHMYPLAGPAEIGRGSSYNVCSVHLRTSFGGRPMTTDSGQVRPLLRAGFNPFEGRLAEVPAGETTAARPSVIAGHGIQPSRCVQSKSRSISIRLPGSIVIKLIGHVDDVSPISNWTGNTRATAATTAPCLASII